MGSTVDGSLEGETVGLVEDGDAVGSSVGTTVGAKEGTYVGIELGEKVGVAVGIAVIGYVGTSEGACVG